MASVQEAKELICELCTTYYQQGWVSGTGGGMSIKSGDSIVMAPSGMPLQLPLVVFWQVTGPNAEQASATCTCSNWCMAAVVAVISHTCTCAAGTTRAGTSNMKNCTRTGVPKERMQPSDMFVLDAAGNVLQSPMARPPPYKPPKLTECAPLFMSVSCRNFKPGPLLIAGTHNL